MKLSIVVPTYNRSDFITNAIDAVLNASDHKYIFMCAKEDFSGYHNFAKTYIKHMINAGKYHKAMNKRKIMR